MPSKKRLALFDFDGTLTTEDTLISFIRFYRGSVSFIFGFLVLSPVLVFMKLKLLPNWKAKQIVLRYFIGGSSIEDFESACRRFSKEKIPKLIRKKAEPVLDELRQQGTIVCVVSASPENWVSLWCRDNGLQCIATRLVIADKKVTGDILGKNCYGIEKVKRIKEVYNLVDFEEIVAYGDSSGDKDMFAISHTHFYRPFR